MSVITSSQLSTLIIILENELGYLEKKSLEYLDSKTANFGKANFTKYWRDMRPAFQGQPWCACFLSWCAAKAGIPQGIVPVFYDCDVGMQWFKVRGQFLSYSETPNSGDIIFFGKPGDATHVGFVLRVENWRVYTIEGNTSAGTSVVANGGAVCAKDYALNNPKILGYGRPKYEEDKDMPCTYEEFKAHMKTFIEENAAKLPHPDKAPAEFELAKASGITDGTRPQDFATRQEAAVMVYRAMIKD